MTHRTTRRSMLRLTGGLAAALVSPSTSWGMDRSPPAAGQRAPLHLNLNENAFGPSPAVASALARELPQLARYGDAVAADALTEQIAAHERVSPEQVILGEILSGLGQYLGSNGGPGGEFLYSTPGYLALINAASHVGGVGVPVPLNDHFENDLPALRDKINARTRAVYLINPHNPTGTVSGRDAFFHFLRDASQRAPIIVDEAYLEYTSDFRERTAVALVRNGANVLVFRTFDKIHGLAGLPIGYTLAPKTLTAAMRREGFGDAESLGRLNMAAASAALADTEHVRAIRETVGAERAKWGEVLQKLGLPHTTSVTNFVFFDANRPHEQIAAAMSDEGVQVARAFPPLADWVRITVGQPSENRAAQEALRKVLVKTQ